VEGGEEVEGGRGGRRGRRREEGGRKEGGRREERMVPCYSLLVRDLMKATDTDHKDYEDLQKAQAEFDKLV
jgi:hypothetical protein